ncbi:MAG: hypothetical protein AB7F43_13010 [Bacteriovoracia bacterium]
MTRLCRQVKWTIASFVFASLCLSTHSSAQARQAGAAVVPKNLVKRANPTTRQPAQQQREPAQSAPVKPATKSAGLLLRWVDARGTVYPGTNVKKMTWVWNKVEATDPTESPALRVWVESELPADWVPVKITGSGMTIAENLRPGKRQTMVLDIRSGTATMRVDFRDQKGSIIEMTLLTTVTVPKPFVVLRPECKKSDITFVQTKASSNHLFVGLHCVDKGDSYDIYFFRSADSKWNTASGLVQFDPENKFTSFKYTGKKPKEVLGYSQRLYRVGTVDGEGRPSEYALYYDPKVPITRLTMSAGIGTTYYMYKEQVGSLDITQISLTGKFNIGYRLIPRILDIGFNMFGNIVHLYHNPTTFESGATLPSARYYGLNGRLGYRLPIGMGALQMFFLTGWYVWLMNVSATSEDETYGIKQLSGPQLFLALVHNQVGHRGWSIYFKYALIADKFQLLSSGREIAMGGSYSLSPTETKPFSVTLDVANAKYSTDENALELTSITLGIQKAL